MPQVLTSWKEIAAHLGNGIRTVQRWEVEFGLPVRRPQGAYKGAILVRTDELDAWLKRFQSRGAGASSRNLTRIKGSDAERGYPAKH